MSSMASTSKKYTSVHIPTYMHVSKYLQAYVQCTQVLKKLNKPRQDRMFNFFLNPTHFCLKIIYRLMSKELWSFKICEKVEKILKGGLDSIPSPLPSVKIQIMSRKVCLRCKSKTFLDIINKLLNTKSFLTSPSNVLPYYLK